MSNHIVPGVYKWVMDDVIEKMNRRFAELGLDENVLHELQQLWESKIIQMNVAPFVQLAPSTSLENNVGLMPPPFGSADLVDLGGGYPSSFTSPDPQLHQSHQVYHQDPHRQQHQYHQPPELSSYTYQSPSALTALASQQHHQENATNQHYRLQQHDGAVDDLPSREELDKTILAISDLPSQSITTDEKQISVEQKRKPQKLSQFDGEDDDEEDDDDDGDNSDIGSDLDDEESDEEDVEVDRMILCQYEKVTRIRNKWRCVLKDGIATINGKDYLFNKANGEFEW